MKYLGIDYGARNIGIAISDAEGMLAFPHRIVPNDKKALAYIVDLITKEQIGRIIMGNTRADNGATNTVTPEAERFADTLSRKTDLPVDLASESWSSYEAARYAPGDTHDDSVAAAVILQRFIDMNAQDTEISLDELE
ncbi:pre-16S rRNA-processing nuclease YqgF [Candidatus Kaiserbacteria bacterium]|nr:pre-16S rRNA-processing nuclease YqgF [Candidatus Kaiserbacteria bacterium]